MDRNSSTPRIGFKIPDHKQGAGDMIPDKTNFERDTACGRRLKEHGPWEVLHFHKQGAEDIARHDALGAMRLARCVWRDALGAMRLARCARRDALGAMRSARCAVHNLRTSVDLSSIFDRCALRAACGKGKGAQRAPDSGGFIYSVGLCAKGRAKGRQIVSRCADLYGFYEKKH